MLAASRCTHTGISAAGAARPTFSSCECSSSSAAAGTAAVMAAAARSAAAVGDWSVLWVNDFGVLLLTSMEGLE